MRSITLNRTGETITIIKTGNDTNREYAEIICSIPAGQDGPPLHIHKFQSESFEAMEGTLELTADGKKWVIEPINFYHVPVNIPHTFANRGSNMLRFRATYRPTLIIDYFLVQSFDRLNAIFHLRKQNFQLMVDFDFILKEIPEQFWIVGFPAIILSLFAAIGKVFSKPKVQSLIEYSEAQIQALQ